MRPATVACIIPAYNAERFLLAALGSVLSQTHALSEVIVVDDGSTDGTAAIVRQLGHWVTLVQVTHGGHSLARDVGIAAAQSEFVALLDADDVWAPEKIARQLAVLQQKPADLCVTHFKNFWDPELADEERRYRDHPLSQPMSGYIVPTLLAPKRVFARFGGFSSEDTPNDTAWFAHAVAAGARLEVVGDVLMYRRFHLGNDSRANPTSLDGLFHLIRARRPRRT